MREIVFKGLDTDDIKYLRNKGREVKEYYGAFYTTKQTAKVPPELPYAYKIDSKAKAETEKKAEEYIGELMGYDEYFNTKAGTLCYAQVRTAPVVDGKDPNTFAYPNENELKILEGYFGKDNIRAESEFIEKQKMEQKEIEERNRFGQSKESDLIG